MRPHNEDFLGVWHPSGEEARLARGTVAVLADGVGGHEAGEVASRLAVDVCLREFATAAIGTTPNQILWRMFNTANLAVFEGRLGIGSTGLQPPMAEPKSGPHGHHAAGINLSLQRNHGSPRRRRPGLPLPRPGDPPDHHRSHLRRRADQAGA